MKRFEDGPCTDASDLLNLCATNRLPISDDGERLERRSRKSLRPCGQLGALDCLGVLRPRKDLPPAANLYQLDAMTVDFIVVAQLFQRRFERGLSIVRMISSASAGIPLRPS